ncbi:chitobiosyldiphosphodolichol beta-mannosyltransferase-like [Stegodyphus dumicola]|nr:chitobiosyldiphosphodolichol beta-mannosyltransferase-like [Stegodyphus dumicola]
MKVVDMFGCCLPVCAFEFQCLHELVKDGVFGKIFSNSRQLSLQFQNFLHDFPTKKTDLDKFRENLTKYGRLEWDENWNFVVYPLLTKKCSYHSN